MCATEPPATLIAGFTGGPQMIRGVSVSGGERKRD